MENFAKLYIEKDVSLYGVPFFIVLDRDPRFTSDFWKSLQEALGSKLRFSSAYHPQKDGHTEQMIQSLEDLLWACCDTVGRTDCFWNAGLRFAFIFAKCHCDWWE